MSIQNTRLGKIRGIDKASCRIFLGVRYGEPPKRFRSPVMSDGWKGVFEATEWPNRAMQTNKEGLFGQRIYGALSEDCLFMNIYICIYIYIYTGSGWQGLMGTPLSPMGREGVRREENIQEKTELIITLT